MHALTIPYDIIHIYIVALKLLVSLISRLVACSARIVVDKQTDRQTRRTTTVTLAAHARGGLILYFGRSHLTPALITAQRRVR